VKPASTGPLLHGQADMTSGDNGEQPEPKTVLVADDEPNVRLLVRTTLQSDEYTVIEASDGDEAWRLLKAHHPPMALLDIHMPGRSGIDLVRAIRADRELSKMVVVLLSSKTDQDDVRAGFAAGANRYLTKPFSPVQLLTIVVEGLSA
jgi:CheY-like chemotaxis protein